MIIEQLLAGVKNTQLTNAVRGLDVTALVLDSRKISAGDVFVALRGAVHNGEDYITWPLNQVRCVHCMMMLLMPAIYPVPLPSVVWR